MQTQSTVIRPDAGPVTFDPTIRPCTVCGTWRSGSDLRPYFGGKLCTRCHDELIGINTDLNEVQN